MLLVQELQLLIRVTTAGWIKIEDWIKIKTLILNGNKVLKRTVGEVEQIYEPTSAEEKQDMRNEMKARGTLLLALPNKDQLKLKKFIGQLEVQGEVLEQEDINLKRLRRSSSTNQNLQNVAFVSLNSNRSTNEANNTTHGVSAAHTQARRFIKRTGRKLDINGQRIRFDRSKVECYNCHKNGHFARECRASKNQENKGRKINRRNITVETPTENALIAQDGIEGYDWSYQAEEEHPTNFALMAYTSSGSSSNSDSEVDSYSKSCVKAYATLKEQYDSLSDDYKKSQFNLVSYKAGLQSIEARLSHYKKNEVVFEESINVLNLEVKLRDNALIENKKKLEKAEKERDELKLKLEKFQNYSKTLNNLLEGQENDKSKSDKEYHAVPLPYTGNYMPPKLDLMFIDEQVESEFVNVVSTDSSSDVKTVESKHETVNKDVFNTVEFNTDRKNSSSPHIIEDWNSDDEGEVEFISNVEDKTIKPSTKKIKFVKTASETVKTPKQNKHHPRGNQRNWNNLMSQRLGSNFKIINKACFICGSFKHLQYVCDQKVVRPVWNNTRRVNHKNFTNKMTHPHPKRRFVPQAVLTKSGKLKTAGTTVNTARPGNLQQKEYKQKGVIDSGCSRHMTGNKCYLTEFEDYDGGFVSFGDGKGRISGKSKIKTGTLDFDDVYFNQTNDITGSKDNIVASQAKKKKEPEQEYIMIPFCTTDPLISQSPKNSKENARKKPTEVEESGVSDNVFLFKNAFALPHVPNVSSMDNTGIFGNAYDDEDVEEEVDMNNVISSYSVPDTSFIKFHKDHPKKQVIGSLETLIEEEVYVCQPPSFEDPDFPDKVYKVEKALYGLHQAPRAWYETLSTYLLDNGFHMGQIDKTLFIKRQEDDILLVQVQQKSDGIFISQDKYVAEILKRFDFATLKTASTPMEPNKALIKDEKAKDVDVHLYRSMIGSLMYLTASRPDITFVVCACASDYAGASLDRKSTTGAEYVAAANCYGQNPVFHSKTKHIEIKHHFIRDSYEKKLIQSSGPNNIVADEIVHKEWGDKMERATTTASSLEAEQDSGNIK
ncbi:putative ribonuclease H-like domain-containing protein [Tanacetum coccineum]